MIRIVLNWFKVHSMVPNPGKSQIMFLGSKIDNSKITFAIENKQMKCKREMKPRGITIDEKLTFMKHIANICSLANNRLRALTRIRRYLSTEEKLIKLIYLFFPFFLLQKLYIAFYSSYVSICKDLQKTIVLSSGPFLQVFTFTRQCICNL